MQNRRGVDWLQQLGATTEGRDVRHVARRMTIEHGDEHLKPIHTYHAVPLPCRAAKGLECLFPI